MRRIIEQAGVLIRKAIPKGKLIPGRPSFKHYIRQLTTQQSYLTNYARAQKFKGAGNDRFIFVSDQRLFDVFFAHETKKISDLSWVSMEGFDEAIPQLFTLDTMPSFMRPFTNIPPDVLTAVDQISENVDRLGLMLDNPTRWVDLKRDYESGREDFIHFTEEQGYYRISIRDHALVEIRPCGRGGMQRELTDAVMACPTLEDTPADIGMLKKCEELWHLTKDCIKRLEKGEVLEMYRDSSLFRFFICIEGKFLFVFADRGNLGPVSERKAANVFQEIMDMLVKNKKTPEFIELPPDLKDKLSIIGDANQYIELIRNGKIKIGGGHTSDMQWRIYSENGVFIKSMDTGYGDEESYTVSEKDLKDIITDKQYGWVRSI